MTQTGKGLIAFALIFGLAGTGLGGFMIVNHYALVNDQNELINDLNDLINRTKQLEEEKALEESYVVPRARVYRLGSYSLDSSTTVTFDYTNTSYDTHNAFNLTSDAYIVPETGFYHIYAQYCITAEDQDFFKINIYVNGVHHTSKSFTASRYTNTFTVSITDFLNTTAGDLITIYSYIYNAGDLSRLVYSAEQYSFFAISKM